MRSNKTKMEEEETMSIDAMEMKPYFTCAICFNIINQVTVINECLHNFCWKCIYGKITEHDWKCCPVCYADLGSEPLEKLRHNHLYEKLKGILFPPEQEGVEKETKSSIASSPFTIDMKDVEDDASSSARY